MIFPVLQKIGNFKMIEEQKIFDEKLDQISSDFEFLDDWEDRYRHIIDLGRNLEPISENDKNEATKVHGCTSQVWLLEKFDKQNNKIILNGDSDSSLVKGLLALMLLIYSNHSPKIIANNLPEPIFIRLKLEEALTPNRSNGLKSMAKRIMDFANKNI